MLKPKRFLLTQSRRNSQNLTQNTTHSDSLVSYVRKSKKACFKYERGDTSIASKEREQKRNQAEERQKQQISTPR